VVDAHGVLHSAGSAVLWREQAQDTLYGPDRLKATLPGWLGGLELWWILCPGIVSVSLAAATAHWLSRRR